MEIIIDDEQDRGFAVELDNQYGRNQMRRFSGWITTAGQMSPKLAGIVDDWIAESKMQILQWLLQCRSYARSCTVALNSYQSAEGDISNSHQSAKRGISNYGQSSKESISNSYQSSEGDILNSYQSAKRDILNSYQSAKRDISNSGQSSEKGISNSYQSSEGDISNSYQSAKRGISNYGQSAKRDISNSYQSTDGEWYMGCIKLTKYPEITKLVRTVKADEYLTLPEFVNWIVDHPDETKRILGRKTGTV
ncbi:MAG: hypothetical protein GY941_21820 [Planctomycetes bacterium]|nr:hypothetical protein [Planctomycetota bacterium]